MAEHKTIVGFFTSRSTAEGAAWKLIEEGVPREDISVVSSEGRRHDTPAVGPIHEIGADTEAGRDATVGAIAGLVAGTILSVIPGIGAILAVGPITAAIAGLGVGAVAGGLIGWLKDEGVSEEEAEYYAEGIRRGGSLVAVRATGDMESRIVRLLEANGAEDLKKLAAEWRAAGWTGFDPKAAPYEPSRSRRAG